MNDVIIYIILLGINKVFLINVNICFNNLCKFLYLYYIYTLYNTLYLYDIYIYNFSVIQYNFYFYKFY